MNKTKLVNCFLSGRRKSISKYENQTEELQSKVLQKLIRQAIHTEWGQTHGFAQVNDYNSFTKTSPINTYEELKGYIDRMRRGEKDVLWSGKVRWYAKSSGTANDKSKFIPVSKEGLYQCHYRGGTDCVVSYLNMNPDSRMFSGKGLILGGSHQISSLRKDIRCGDLSACLIQNINPLVNLIRVPEKRIALMSEWEKKLEEIVRSTLHKNVTNLSGVPSWFLTLIKKILQQSGKQYLSEVWPNLEVFFHGGISFEPYRSYYKELIPSEKMHYVETYNASEGFFAVQNSFDEQGMLLLLDIGVFFEFIPLSEVGKKDPVVLPIWEIEKGQNYALVITTNSGLWRYQIGDTVKVTSTDPAKIIISGRTKHFINAFGEELMVDNAEKGLAKTCEQTGAIISNYSAAPVFMSNKSRGRHQWLIEFEKEPESLEQFADILDATLQSLNSDYEAKRYKGIFLDRLEIIKARPGLFHDWLKDKGKLGGQHKIPRLSNSREHIEDMLKMNH